MTVKTPHKWTASGLGHGEWQCVYCLATNREIAVIGDPNHCPDAHKALFPALANLDTSHDQEYRLGCNGLRRSKAVHLRANLPHPERGPC